MPKLVEAVKSPEFYAYMVFLENQTWFWGWGCSGFYRFSVMKHFQVVQPLQGQYWLVEGPAQTLNLVFNIYILGPCPNFVLKILDPHIFYKSSKPLVIIGPCADARCAHPQMRQWSFCGFFGVFLCKLWVLIFGLYVDFLLYFWRFLSFYIACMVLPPTLWSYSCCFTYKWTKKKSFTALIYFLYFFLLHNFIPKKTSYLVFFNLINVLMWIFE